MHNELTNRQREALEAVINYVEAKNYPPSYRELGALIGLSSSSTVCGLLNKLKDKGFVSWEDGQPRTLRILKTAS